MLSQFHSMSAYISNNLERQQETFISYKTNISTYNELTNTLEVGCNFNCTPTTRKQFSRYLRERFNLAYPTVKEAILHTTETGELTTLNGITILPAEHDNYFYKLQGWTSWGFIN